MDRSAAVSFVPRVTTTLHVKVDSRLRWSWRWPFARWEHLFTIDPPPPRGTTVIIEGKHG